MAEETPPWVAKAKNGGFFVQYRGASLYSRVDPQNAPERTASDFPVQPDTLYLVPSPLLGYGLETLLGRIPDSSAVLALEADPELARLTAARLPDTVLGNPRFRFLTELPLAARAVHGLGRFRRCGEVSLSFGRKLHPEAYERARQSVDAELSRYWRNRMTMIHMSRLWMRNIVRNLGRLADADIQEAEKWETPVVVCGAGPSLDSACAWISAERSRILVLACDTAVGALVSRGILPDTIVCLEGQIHNLKDFLPAGAAPLPVFLDLTSHPSAFHAVRGPKILTMTRFEELAFLDRLESLPLPALRVPPLGSVGVLAVRLARMLSCGPIFLSGLDFSFLPGATHAKGSPAQKMESLRETRLYKARSQWMASFSADEILPATGERSGPVLSSYAETLADEILGDSRIFDIRPCGLSLGLSRTPLEEASRMLDAAAKTPSAASGRIPPGAPFNQALRGSQAASFLAGERSRLERLLASLRADGADLQSRAAECDWIYSWFPDEHRVPGLPGDVRNRLLAEALDWIRRIDESLSTLEHPRDSWV